MKTAHSQSKPHRSPQRSLGRRGFTTPAVAIAMLVALAGFALVIDRMWLDAADLELTACAESAALAAAAELVGDDMLSQNPDPAMRLEHAVTAAAMIAGQNTVAGAPVVLDTRPQQDVRFGNLVLNSQSGLVQFSETEESPATVLITARKTRQSSNPVGLFLSGVTGIASGEVATRVEATVDNRIIGVRPPENAAVPAFPLAIWYVDPTGQRTDTWSNQIESRGGQDNFGYDQFAHRVTSGPDGIPEIVLHSQAKGQKITDVNVSVVDVGAGLNDDVVTRQFTNGWTATDLSSQGGEFLLSSGATQTLQACGELTHGDRRALQSMIGQSRICLLYSMMTPSAQSIKGGKATCIGLVAIRVVSVTDMGNAGCQLVAQPCVIKTRAALLNQMTPYYMTSNSQSSSGSATGSTGGDQPQSATIGQQSSGLPASPNPYIYTLRLTQ